MTRWVRPIGRTEGSGACDDEVEEARAELYRQQARKLRLENEAAEVEQGKNAGGSDSTAGTMRRER